MWPVCHVSTSFAARDAVQSGCCALMTMTHIMSTTPRDCTCMPWHYCYCLPHIMLQVSGYIDYAQRLAADPSAEGYFSRTRRMLPRPSDLSYYNWETQLSTSNPTPTWQVCLAHHARPCACGITGCASRALLHYFHNTTLCWWWRTTTIQHITRM